MAAYTLSTQSDMLDLIAWKHYGSSSGAVEAMLSDPRNYRLSNKPEILPMLTKIVLPDLQTGTQSGTVRLWS